MNGQECLLCLPAQGLEAIFDEVDFPGRLRRAIGKACRLRVLQSHPNRCVLSQAPTASVHRDMKSPENQ